MLKITPILFNTILFSALFPASSSEARLNIVSAGITTGYDYSETDYDRDKDDEAPPSQDQHTQKLSIGPIFIFESSSSIDQLSINYSPQLCLRH